jgi:hypothetical protein
LGQSPNVEPPLNPPPTSTKPEIPRLQPGDLPKFRLGLVLVAAGLLLSLIMLEWLIRLQTRPFFALPAFVAGMGLLAWGGTLIASRPGGGTAASHRLPRLSLALLYFCPFLLWFLQKPSVYYLAINVLLMQLCLTGWLVALNEHLALVSVGAGDKSFHREAKTAEWGAMILHTFLVIFVLARVIAHQLEIGGLRFPFMMLAPWKPVFILPCLFTVLTALRAAYLCPGWLDDEDPRAD